MHVLRILLLVMTAGVLAFILYQAITQQYEETLSGLWLPLPAPLV